MRIPPKDVIGGAVTVDLEQVDRPVEAATLPLGKIEAPPERSWREWPGLTKEMLLAHAAHFGVDPEASEDLVGALEAIELKRAVEADTVVPPWATDERVTPAQLEGYVTLSRQAERLAAVPQAVVFGFTRLIDGNFDLGADAVLRKDGIDPWRGGGDRRKKRALEALADCALDGMAGARDPAKRERRKKKLEALIDRGPPDGGVVWRRPKNEIELVASIVRQIVLRPGDSEHILLHEKLAGWLEDVLADHDVTLREAMGGAGVFGANVAATQEEVAPRFFAADGMPARIASRCGAAVQGIDGEGRVRTLDKCRTEESARVNYIANYEAGSTFSIFGRDTMSIDGKRRKLRPKKDGRIILGKPGRQTTTFGDVTEEALAKIARSNDAIVLSGLDYHTAAPPGECPLAEELAGQLEVMRRANPELQIHWIYKVPKKDENEPLLLQAIRGKVDSIDLNATELPGLLTRMAAAGMVDYEGPPFPKEAQLQDPSFIIDAANLLMGAMKLHRLNVRGFPLNLLIVDDCRDPARQRGALFAAGSMAMRKAATPSGELTKPEDLQPVPHILDGSGLAAAHAFADKLEADFGLGPEAHDTIVNRLWGQDPKTGRTYVAAPSKRFYATKGGLVSCGDTMGVTAFLLGREKQGRRPLLHYQALVNEL